MTIHVTIGEAEKRLSELVAAAVRGEEVVLQEAGAPQVRLVAIARAALGEAEREAIAARRVAAIGKWKKDFEGFDTTRAALKADYPDPDEKIRRILGSDI